MAREARSNDTDVFFCAGPRTPFAKIDGPLAHLDAVGVSVPVVREAGAKLKPGAVPDCVVWGAVVPSLSVIHIAREVWLDAGLEPHVPALTVIQQCATSLAAATHAAAQMKAGRIDLALCGGSEAMSQTQVGLTRGMSQAIRRLAQAKGAGAALKALGKVRPRDLKLRAPSVRERTSGLTMGDHAEITAKEWGLDRESQDRFALASHQNAVAAWERGFFDDLVIGSDAFPGFRRDNIPRTDTSPAKLAKLPPVFDRKSGRGMLTAGNSSPLTDGAAACWVATERGLERFAAPPYRARLLDWEVTSVDIERDGLLMAPTLAVPRLLARNGLSYGDIGLWEIHEAFAAQVLCTIAALNSGKWLSERAGVDVDLGEVPEERINPNGGSVALGHPFGATGARIVSQTVKALQARGGSALISICAAGGLGHVALLEAV
ncbi:MAG: acetyl-CoA C-acyltransferase [Gemmatimonadota bacterium]|nr:MAG: acetyl-CoA C-acyltransferase [Gemmatimonadota bacterium]